MSILAPKPAAVNPRCGEIPRTAIDAEPLAGPARFELERRITGPQGHQGRRPGDPPGPVRALPRQGRLLARKRDRRREGGGLPADDPKLPGQARGGRDHQDRG